MRAGFFIMLLPLSMFSSAGLAQSFQDGVLQLPQSNGMLTLTIYSPHAAEVVWEPTSGPPNPPRVAIAATPIPTPCTVTETESELHLVTEGLEIRVRQNPLQLRFSHQGRLLLDSSGDGLPQGPEPHFRFHLQDGEKLFGAGSRVLGKMDRRGERLDLYNSASYAYSDEARLMYYSMPAVVSSRKYMLAFDNGARGFLDVDSRGTRELEFGAVGGRRAYVIVAGTDWRHLADQVARLTGRQPLLPRWALGHIASRMGYHSQEEVESVVAQHRAANIPLDAIVLDLFWFGSSIFGNMGNLDWDLTHFPQPIAMMDRLREQGVQTILITEPLMLKESRNWQAAVDHHVLATDHAGGPYTFASFFGEAALIDVFKPEARSWFWSFYRRHTQSGVAGWWGDLGEPETHPDDIQHSNGRGVDVHNLYGHAWAGLVYEGFRKDVPQRRPFILMRSGFVGTQRYGIVPWSGDVQRSWGGLKAQVELSLQMGLQGIGYMHSDLGGFVGDVRDPELYQRWLQFGVFQPIYRPHGHERVPSEPIFWDDETQRIVRRSIQWRYQLLPYNYTLMFENATTGLPLMRPLMYADDRPEMQDELGAYLWGDAFLVAPIVEPGARTRSVPLPGNAVWFDAITGTRYQGGQTISVPVQREHIPFFIRGGTFVAMAKAKPHTGLYDGHELFLHYYADRTATSSTGQCYDDDGVSFDSYTNGRYELLQFRAELRTNDLLEIVISGERHEYPGRPDQRMLHVVIHGLAGPPQKLLLDEQQMDVAAVWNVKTRLLTVPVTWSGAARTLRLFRPFSTAQATNK